jgi:hypothetical protein
VAVSEDQGPGSRSRDSDGVKVRKQALVRPSNAFRRLPTPQRADLRSDPTQAYEVRFLFGWTLNCNWAGTNGGGIAHGNAASMEIANTILKNGVGGNLYVLVAPPSSRMDLTSAATMVLDI